MPNVYFLFGNDEFAIARRLNEFAADFSDPTSADMNTARLEARTMTENDLNTAVNAMPFLAPKRLVLLANPSAKYNTPETRKKFEEFLNNVPDTARLILHEAVDTKSYKDKTRQDKEDDKHWLVKWGRKNGIELERYALPAPRDMAGWIISEAQNQNGQIEPRAAAKLAEMVGVDTRQAGMEIAKLLAYVNWARPVKVEDVEAVSIVTAEPDIFSLVDALANGQAGEAQKLLHRLLDTEDAFALWGMIIRQFRLLLQAREVIDAHGMVPDVQEALGVHPFVAEKTYAQAKHFTMISLESIYHRLLEMDEAAKTSQVTLDLALDMFVGELAK